MKTKTRSIKELAPKPSDALQAMVDGLRKQSRRKNFRIKMSTFGDAEDDGKTCYGCAATCTLQQIAHKNFTPKAIINEDERAMFLGFETEEVDDFEVAIDHARHGAFSYLFLFYEVDEPKRIYPKERFYLDDYDWEEQLPAVEDYIYLLKTAGL